MLRSRPEASFIPTINQSMSDQLPSDNFMRAILRDTLGRAIEGDHTPSTLTRESVASETCNCVRCPDCGGSGSYWIDQRGHYLGQHRSDDMDDLEHCDSCGGSGITEVCGRCEYLADLDRELFWGTITLTPFAFSTIICGTHRISC